MIVCLGLSPALDVTYLVERTTLGTIHRPRKVISLAGGKALNVARAASTLGARVHAIAPLGGFNGERVRERHGAFDIRVVSTESETRTCLTVIDDSGVTTEFYEAAAPLGDAAWQNVEQAVDHALECAPAQTRWLALSGSVARGDEFRFAALLDAAARSGVSVAVDTHGAALRAVIEHGGAALVKVNRNEAAELLSLDAPTADLAVRLRERSGAVAVVTAGAAGAAAASTAGSLLAPPLPGGPYAVGSGDCFLAGLLARLDARPDDFRGALALAGQTAAANTRRPGAALFDPADAARLQASLVSSEVDVGESSSAE